MEEEVLLDSNTFENVKKDDKIAPVNRIFLWTVLISLLASTVISIVYGLFAGIIAEDEVHYDRLIDKFIEFYDNDMISIVLSQFLLFLPVGIYIIGHRKRFISNIRFKMLSLKTLLMLVAFTFTITPVMSFINSISLLFSDNVINETVSGITQNNSMLVSLLVVALLPAVCEEIAYRGVFYSEYSKFSSKKAILLSGLLFGMLHMNINQFVYAAAMGMVFALVVEATDSILSTMTIHLISNGTSVLAMYAVSGEGMEVAEADTQTISEMFGEMANEEGINPAMSGVFEKLSTFPDEVVQVIVLGVIALIFGTVAFVLFIQIAKSCGRYDVVRGIFLARYRTDEPQKEGKIFTPSLYVAILICSVFMVYRQIAGI